MTAFARKATPGSLVPAIKTTGKLWHQYHRLSQVDDPEVRALARAAMSDVQAITNRMVDYLTREAK